MGTVIGFLTYFFKQVFFFVSFVKNNTFPQPLPPEEEKKYLEQFANGNADARNKLIEHNLRLVAHIVKKFENTGEEQEDLISIGTIGLIKAVESFSSGKGTKLATYAARCIENEISLARVTTKRERKTAINKEIRLFLPPVTSLIAIRINTFLSSSFKFFSLAK